MLSKLLGKIDAIAKIKIRPATVAVVCTTFAVGIICVLDGLVLFSREFWFVTFTFYTVYDVMAFYPQENTQERKQQSILIAYGLVFVSFFLIGIGVQAPIFLIPGSIILSIAGCWIVLFRLAQLFSYISKLWR